jgi:hypothetical protein
MIGDARYAAQHWLAAHVGADDLVGHMFDLEYSPRLDEYRHTDIHSIEDLRKERPAYYVLNADYAKALSPGDPKAPARLLVEGLQEGTLGYRLVYRYRRQPPWRWLPGAHPDLYGAREETEVASTLFNVNPLIEIFARESSTAAR